MAPISQSTHPETENFSRISTKESALPEPAGRSVLPPTKEVGEDKVAQIEKAPVLTEAPEWAKNFSYEGVFNFFVDIPHV